MNKSKPTFTGFVTDAQEDEVLVQNQATVRTASIITYHGKKYRLFSLDGLSPELGQQWICHYILVCREFDKLYWKGNWYYEIKPHECRLECIDSGGKWIGTGSDREWVWWNTNG
jgi:hypothetical protein